MLLACDQSVRGFALAWTDTGLGRSWAHVHTARFDGGPVKRGDDAGALQRLIRVFQWVDRYLVDLAPDAVGFESYGFSARPDMNVVELVGAIKLRCMHYGIDVQTVQMGSARKRVAGVDKVPRAGKDAKASMAEKLKAAGAPATLSLDETDALVILNNMLYTTGVRPLVETV